MLPLLRRVLLLPLFRLLWALLLAVSAYKLLGRLFPHLAKLPNVTLAGSVRNAVIFLLVLFVTVRFLERRRLRDVGLRPSRAVPDTLLGFLLGAGLITAVVGILALSGSYHLEGWAPLQDGTRRSTLVLQSLAFLLAVAVFEEISTRGIIFRLLEEALGTWLAIAISAAVFGLGHRGNPGATWVSSTAIALEAGVLLAAVYVATRSLWLPIGMHWAWNLFEGPVWGSPVSGNDMGVLAHASFPGPALLTGGPFGPEAGLPAMILGGALGISFLVLAVQRDQIVTPHWMRWLGERLRRQAPLPSSPASVVDPLVPPSPG